MIGGAQPTVLHVTTTDISLELLLGPCLLYTSDAADERSSVDLGGRRIIKKKKNKITRDSGQLQREHQRTRQ